MKSWEKKMRAYGTLHGVPTRNDIGLVLNAMDVRLGAEIGVAFRREMPSRSFRRRTFKRSSC